MKEQQQEFASVKQKKKRTKRTSKKSSVCHEALNTYKSFDIYGEPVQLTYKGENKYTTTLGATLTFIFYGLMAIYIGFNLYFYFADISTNTNSDTVYIDLNQESAIQPA